ncbi:MAG: IPTL-CTERM sorting domain-containing protein [Lysobacterales bacterium]
MHSHPIRTLLLLSALGSATPLAAQVDGYTTPTVTPTSLNFGDTALGSSSAAQTITVATVLRIPDPLAITSITLPAGFIRSGGTCPSSGAAPNPCTIEIRFSPTMVGAQSGNVVVVGSSFGAPNGSANVAVSGNGLPGNIVAAPSLNQTGLALLALLLGGLGLWQQRRG